MERDIYQVFFDGNDLGASDFVDLYNHNFNNYPKRDVKIYKIARASKSIVTNAELTSKDISVYMTICDGTRGGTERIISDVKSLLVAQTGELVVLNAGIRLAWTASLNEFNTEWDGVTATCELRFIASTPIGSSLTAYELFNIQNITTSTANQTGFVQGSYECEPVFTMVFSALDNTSGLGGFSLYNAKTNQGIDCSFPILANDIIIIDSKIKSVTQNGIQRDFKGVFPRFDPNTQSLGYTDTYASRNVSIVVTYNINEV